MFKHIVAQVLLALLLTAAIGGAVMRLTRPKVDPTADHFAQQVDLRPLGELAVMTEGRVKSFDSFANQMMQFVSGPRTIAGQSHAFTYLDMMFRPEAYRDADVIYIKNKQVRQQIAETLLRERGDDALRQRMEAFRATGLISPLLLSHSSMQPLMQRLASDFIRTARTVDEINQAQAVMNPDVLMGQLRVIPTTAGAEAPWRSLLDVWPVADEAGRPAPAPQLPDVDPAVQNAVAAAWVDFRIAWSNTDAPGVHAASIALASAARAGDPQSVTYPSTSRLSWESWYFRAKGLTFIWVVYVLALAVLSMSFVYRWPGARTTGMTIFLVAFAFHTFALGLRWYVSGRWPNSNMFEAVTTAAWFGGAGAIVLEILARRSPLRSLFAMGSALSSMVAMMAAHFLPVQLNANISNMMPVLHDVWLYIHTNVIIFSYCLIFMAAGTGVGYLIYRLCGGAPDFARAGGTAMLMDAELAGAPGEQPRAAMGAAAAAELRAPRRASIGEVLDGATMILMELSFILLFAGIVMGAIWADHSWGRPWGWDPKEVFALNTFIVFALLIHVRLKVKDKGLWTAILAVVGAGVMLFNWIVINFVISGLHSYA